MLFCALMASGEIVLRKAGGWQTLTAQPLEPAIDLAA
jgi:hypothetical protein